MASARCILQKSIPWIAILTTFSALIANFSGFWVLSIFSTSLILIISAIIFVFSTQIEEETVQEEVPSDHISNEQQDTPLFDQDSKTVQEVPVSKDEHCLNQTEKSSLGDVKTVAISQVKVLQHGLGGGQTHMNYLVRSSQHDHLYSESESIDRSVSSEDSDIDWPYSCKFGQSPECSDDSISDEESLIEIAIPSGHYVCPKEELKISFQQKFQDLSSETFFNQQRIMELFAEINEMNEEENLIEIDLSMGSIKCSRFEIEA